MFLVFLLACLPSGKASVVAFDSNSTTAALLGSNSSSNIINSNSSSNSIINSSSNSNATKASTSTSNTLDDATVEDFLNDLIQNPEGILRKRKKKKAPVATTDSSTSTGSTTATRRHLRKKIQVDTVEERREKLRACIEIALEETTDRSASGGDNETSHDHKYDTYTNTDRTIVSVEDLDPDRFGPGSLSSGGRSGADYSPETECALQRCFTEHLLEGMTEISSEPLRVSAEYLEPICCHEPSAPSPETEEQKPTGCSKGNCGGGNKKKKKKKRKRKKKKKKKRKKSSSSNSNNNNNNGNNQTPTQKPSRNPATGDDLDATVDGIITELCKPTTIEPSGQCWMNYYRGNEQTRSSGPIQL